MGWKRKRSDQNYLVKKGVEQRLAFFTMESVRKGKGLTEDMEKAMRENNVPDWFIGSCKKIKYMFPKAHAVAYVVMSLRIAYCKVHYPKEYYAMYFTVHAEEFDATYVLGGREKILRSLEEFEAKGQSATATEKNMIVLLDLAYEMYARGIAFLPVNLEKSMAYRFTIEGNNIRLPFVTIPKLGGTAAESLESARGNGEFISIEDVKKRARISSAVIDTMRQMGCFSGMPENNQLSIFDL